MHRLPVYLKSKLHHGSFGCSVCRNCLLPTNKMSSSSSSPSPCISPSVEIIERDYEGLGVLIVNDLVVKSTGSMQRVDTCLLPHELYNVTVEDGAMVEIFCTDNAIIHGDVVIGENAISTITAQHQTPIFGKLHVKSHAVSTITTLSRACVHGSVRVENNAQSHMNCTRFAWQEFIQIGQNGPVLKANEAASYKTPSGGTVEYSPI